MSIPTSGAALGSSSTTTTVTKIGNRIFSVLETVRSCVMTTERSFLVVSARMIGGWMIGTSAIYEYAAMAIAPSRCGASFEVR